MIKPVIRFRRAWAINKNKVGRPEVQVALYVRGSNDWEMLTVHEVDAITYNENGSITRFETRHKIYVLVKE